MNKICYIYNIFLVSSQVIQILMYLNINYDHTAFLIGFLGTPLSRVGFLGINKL